MTRNLRRVRSVCVSVTIALGLAVATGMAAMQASPPTTRTAGLLQLAVTDAIGHPIPDATVEVYAVPDGGQRKRYWEWFVINPEMLPEGITLLRISSPEFRPTVVSVPLRRRSQLALQVALSPVTDSSPPDRGGTVHSIRGVGTPLWQRGRPNVLDGRQVLVREEIARTAAETVRQVMERSHGFDLRFIPAAEGRYRLTGSRGDRIAAASGGGGLYQRTVLIDVRANLSVAEELLRL